MTRGKDLYAYGDVLTEKMGREVTVRRCVFGHGYPACGCPWKLYYVTPITGGLTTAMVLGDTIPKATMTLRGILFGLTERKD